MVSTLCDSKMWQEKMTRLIERQNRPNKEDLSPQQRARLKAEGFRHIGAVAPLFHTTPRSLDAIRTKLIAAHSELERDTFATQAERELQTVAVWWNSIRYHVRKVLVVIEYADWDLKLTYTRLLGLFDRLDLL